MINQCCIPQGLLGYIVYYHAASSERTWIDEQILEPLFLQDLFALSHYFFWSISLVVCLSIQFLFLFDCREWYMYAASQFSVSVAVDAAICFSIECFVTSLQQLSGCISMS